MISRFAAAGIAAVLLAVAVVIWAAGLVTQPQGSLVLPLVIALFVAGGGFATFWFGLVAGIAATHTTAPAARWRTWLGARLTRLRAWLWPWLFIAYLAWAAGSWMIAATSNTVMPAVTAATPLVLALILLSYLAHDSQHSQAAQHPGGPPPNGRDEQVEVRHDHNRG